jgi:hypothetical protein
MNSSAYTRTLTDEELAELLEFSAPFHEAEIATAVMKEAAKRLRRGAALRLLQRLSIHLDCCHRNRQLSYATRSRTQQLARIGSGC